MLELQHISFAAETGKEILSDVNLTLGNEVTAITGPNGGGKSTLARVIAGIVTPSEGKLLLNGEDITNLSITERAKKGISFAFQQPVRFKGLRVRDLLALAMGKPDDGRMADACEVLSEVGLCARDYLDRELNDSLSGGEMKRIEIAMTIARGAEINIFDEPEAGIDLWSFQNLIHVFENMRTKKTGGIVIISHQERILNIADKVVYVREGKVEKYGTRDEVLPGLLHSVDSTCSVLTGKMGGQRHA